MGGDSLITHKIPYKHQLEKQKALETVKPRDPEVFFQELYLDCHEDSDAGQLPWAKKEWAAVITKASCEWHEQDIIRVLNKIIVVNPDQRATIEDLYLDKYFANTRQECETVRMPGVDTEDYESVKSYLFYSQTIQGRVYKKGDTKQKLKEIKTQQEKKRNYKVMKKKSRKKNGARNESAPAKVMKV